MKVTEDFFGPTSFFSIRNSTKEAFDLGDVS